jgi:crossover junction endodeoxyribonuclease RuvC
MRILGIDPGYERLGIAVLEKNTDDKRPFGKAQGKEQVIFSECFKTSAKLGFPERLLLIGEEVRNIIKKYKPEVLSIETLFLTNNQKTVMHVAEVRGVILYEAMKAGLKIFEASPPQIKMATTGSGHADKAQIIKMVRMLVDVDPVRGREGSQRPSASNGTDDELDAIAIALTAFAHLKTK